MRYDLNNILGKSGFGTVFSGYYLMSESSELEVAVKRIEWAQWAHVDEPAQDAVQKEVDIMKKLDDHPKILRFICTETNADYL